MFLVLIMYEWGYVVLGNGKELNKNKNVKLKVKIVVPYGKANRAFILIYKSGVIEFSVFNRPV